MVIKSRRQRRSFFFSFFITAFVLCLMTGLFWADCNTRLVSGGAHDWVFHMARHGQQLVVKWWDTQHIWEIPSQITYFIYKTADFLPSHFQLFCKGVSAVFDFLSSLWK